MILKKGLSLLLFAIILCTSSLLNAQGVDAKYYRRSVTFLMVENDIPEGYEAQTRKVWSKLKPGYPKRVDYNPIEKKFVQVKADTLNDFTLAEALVEEKITNDLVAYWWMRDEDGAFDIVRVGNRGAASATVAEMGTIDQDIRGLARVKDGGEQLIDLSLLVVFDYNDFKTYQEHYNEIDAKNRERARKSQGTYDFEPVDRTYRGYMGNVTVRIYRLAFLGEPAAEFYNTMWVDESTDDAERQARIEAFENYPFPVEHVKTLRKKIYGRETIAESNSTDPDALNVIKEVLRSGPKSMEELFESMIASGAQQSQSLIMNQSQIIARLSGKRPLRAYIGKREDMMIDSRYFVFEPKIVTSSDGTSDTLLLRRKAVIRASKVSQNDLKDGLVDVNIEPSEFYRISGMAPLGAGMILKEQNDLGVFISAYYRVIGDISGFGLRGDYMISKFFNEGWTGLHAGAFIAFQSSDEFGPFGKDLNFSRFGLGLRRDYYLIPFVRVGIGLDGGMISINDPDVDDPDGEGFDNAANAFFVTPNVELGIHVWHNIQLVGSAKYYPFWITPERGDNYRGTLSQDDIDAIFNRYRGENISAGVRYNF